jgi:hypothetical protein
MLPSIAVVAFPIFVMLRCIERSVFGPMVPDLGHLLSRAQGGTMLYPQEPPVLEDLYRQGVCRGTRVVVEARGYHVPIRKGFGTQGSAEVVIDLHWTIQII